MYTLSLIRIPKTDRLREGQKVKVERSKVESAERMIKQITPIERWIYIHTEDENGRKYIRRRSLETEEISEEYLIPKERHVKVLTKKLVLLYGRGKLFICPQILNVKIGRVTKLSCESYPLDYSTNKSRSKYVTKNSYIYHNKKLVGYNGYMFTVWRNGERVSRDHKIFHYKNKYRTCMGCMNGNAYIIENSRVKIVDLNDVSGQVKELSLPEIEQKLYTTDPLIELATHENKIVFRRIYEEDVESEIYAVYKNIVKEYTRKTKLLVTGMKEIQRPENMQAIVEFVDKLSEEIQTILEKYELKININKKWMIKKMKQEYKIFGKFECEKIKYANGYCLWEIVWKGDEEERLGGIKYIPMIGYRVYHISHIDDDNMDNYTLEGCCKAALYRYSERELLKLLYNEPNGIAYQIREQSLSYSDYQVYDGMTFTKVDYEDPVLFHANDRLWLEKIDMYRKVRKEYDIYGKLLKEEPYDWTISKMPNQDERNDVNAYVLTEYKSYDTAIRTWPLGAEGLTVDKYIEEDEYKERICKTLIIERDGMKMNIPLCSDSINGGNLVRWHDNYLIVYDYDYIMIIKVIV